MKIEFFIKKEQHPLFVEYKNKVSENLFGDINKLFNTKIGFDYKDNDNYEKFCSIKIDKESTSEQVLKVINIFQEEITKKFNYVKKENILYKIIEE